MEPTLLIAAAGLAACAAGIVASAMGLRSHIRGGRTIDLPSVVRRAR